MIEIVHMPVERQKFAHVLDSINLRCDSYQNNDAWIGQSKDSIGTLEECDRSDCFHIVNYAGETAVGYARMRPLQDLPQQESVSGTISTLARQSDRYPAFELQSVSFPRCDSEDDGLGDQTGTDLDDTRAGDPDNSTGILRELVVEALRIANNRHCKFIYTTSDSGGTAQLRNIGLRYSTLSTPFNVNGRPMVILCIAVTNANILALSPLRLVGGTEVGSPVFLPPEGAIARPSEFDRLQALASLNSLHDDDSSTDNH